MGKQLEKVVSGNDLHQSDDDHPERKDLTDKQAKQAMQDMVKKFKDQPKVEVEGDPQALAKETVKALNKIK